MLLAVMVANPGQPDRDAAREVLARLRMMRPQPAWSGVTAPMPGRWRTWARLFLRLTVGVHQPP
jgi:hypothetical protein